MKYKIKYSENPGDDEHQDRLKGLSETLGKSCTVRGYTWGIEIEGDNLSRDDLIDRVHFGGIERLEEVA